jgi:hypothetical protein
MASRVHTRRERAYEGGDLGTTIAAYLRDAEAGRAVDAAGRPYTPAGLRGLRRALVHVEAQATSTELAAADAMGAAALERLGRQIVANAGLPPGRLGSIVAALRELSAYAAGDMWSDPPGLRPGAQRPADPPRWERPPHPAEAPSGYGAAGTPTYAMVALGAQVSAWLQRIIVIAFVLTAIGLALELV